jgi:hypothetical protein
LTERGRKKETSMKRIIGTALGAAIALAAAAGPASAMPAFARKYTLTCKACHSPFPKLKPFGEEFAADGFVIKNKETPRYYVETGDDRLSLLRDVPFAFRLEGYLAYDNGRSKTLDFTSPYLLKFLSGGEIAKHISYYFYFFFGERGEVAGLEDAFIMINDLFGPDLDLYAGQFQVSDPLFKRELRLPFEDYEIYAVRVGGSKANLTYDRGLMATLGLKSGTDVCFEIVNGSGLDPTDPFGNFDGDRYKNFFFRLSQDVGADLRLGGFGYLGKEKQEEAVNGLWMAGVDATLEAAPFQLNLQYVERRDDNPFFSAFRPMEIRTRGGFAELIFRPLGDNGRWYAVGLVNAVDSGQEDLKSSTATLHTGYLLRRNLRATAEVTWIFKGPAGRHARAGIGLITAF